jgi:hypothetical protein
MNWEKRLLERIAHTLIGIERAVWALIRHMPVVVPKIERQTSAIAVSVIHSD